MDTRREFIKKAMLLTGTAAGWTGLPASIEKALAINPEPGTTYLDAEHIVILMQENRSFDHCYGTLQGVRGFNDPRAFRLPNQNPVWLQTNKDGETYAPFRLNIKDTKATWMGSLPHAWSNQVDARNQGNYDQWLPVKHSFSPSYSKMPLTLGYYTREDIPFYYAFADAFTACDQHFCSSLTGTTCNRLFLWSGTNREQPHPFGHAKVYNEEADFDSPVNWTPFPERLEDLGISWKIYQNEIALSTGFRGEEASWLSNFGCNPMEFFSQFQVRFSPAHRAHLDAQAKTLQAEIEELKANLVGFPEKSEARETLQKEVQERNTHLADIYKAREQWSAENFAKLPARTQNMHRKAFCTNTGDPHYRELEALTYEEGGKKRQVKVPKGDLFHQFRQDVQSGQLPTVSWLVGPEHFSDHPTSAWYGAWYVSEALEILTQNPEVWKKTIFILTYDENDGYFDHVPPFVVPNPTKSETGAVSKGLDTRVDYIDLEQDKASRPKFSPRESSIGLGYRVPMVIASPWSRGGCVCSEVFDHTSPLQFLEKFLSHKTGKKVEEANISPWRRSICGDLTSAFQPYHGEKITPPTFIPRDPFIEGIHKAQFKQLPSDYKALSSAELAQIRHSPTSAPLLPKQEVGIRRSSALPYQFYADGVLSADKTRFRVQLEARKDLFGDRSAGAPFHVYAYLGENRLEARAYAVVAGDTLSDTWELSAFQNRPYHLRVDGPNGFHREFQGTANDPLVEIQVGYAGTKTSLTGQIEVQFVNRDSLAHTIEISDLSYQTGTRKLPLPARGKKKMLVDTKPSHGWYDFSVRLVENETFVYRYAGRVETGKWSYSDPAMGKG